MRRRVRREPIDLERLVADLAEPTDLAETLDLEAILEPAETADLQAILEPAELDVDLRDPEPTPAEAEAAPDEPLTATRSEHDIVAALEAEVLRATKVRAVETVQPLVPPPVVSPPRSIGLPLDQVRAWLEQVKDDLRKVQARLQYLEVEHAKLQEQHHLVAELISTSPPA